MATVSKTRYTPEDLLNITDRPMPELIDGELVEREMGQKSDSIALRIGRLVGNYVDDHDLGLCNGAQGSYQVFVDDPEKVRIPDSSFTRKDRVPEDGPAEGHARVVPDLIVEVVSPNDSVGKLNRKINDFLNAGVVLIWVVYPDTKTVQVHRIDGSGKTLKIGDFLEGETVLPGFRVEVAELFA
jgi:Uma2 family endonuclease